MRPRAHEAHKLGKVGWLRAGVLGANDGIVSTASLIVGVAAAHASHADILLTGVAGLVAGAMSMATGEYVSVHSQADTEAAALAEEKVELEVEHSGRVDSHIVLTEARRAELLERRRAAVALANPDRPAQTGRATAGASTGAMGKGK